MITWNTYYIEAQRRQDEIAETAQDRFMRSASGSCESTFTKLNIRMLNAVGTKLVDWGSHLQCRCAELAMSASKRAV